MDESLPDAHASWLFENFNVAPRFNGRKIAGGGFGIVYGGVIGGKLVVIQTAAQNAAVLDRLAAIGLVTASSAGCSRVLAHRWPCRTWRIRGPCQRRWSSAATQSSA